MKVSGFRGIMNYFANHRTIGPFFLRSVCIADKNGCLLLSESIEYPYFCA
jgi:hypothetical protein